MRAILLALAILLGYLAAPVINEYNPWGDAVCLDHDEQVELWAYIRHLQAAAGRPKEQSL